jgi:hypothetical protein
MIETIYELVNEELNADNDIVDCHYWPVDAEGRKNFLQQRAALLKAGVKVDSALCRRRIDTWEGDVDRQYAYFEFSGGTLPAEFDGGADIPKRFRDLRV